MLLVEAFHRLAVSHVIPCVCREPIRLGYILVSSCVLVSSVHLSWSFTGFSTDTLIYQ